MIINLINGLIHQCLSSNKIGKTKKKQRTKENNKNKNFFVQILRKEKNRKTKHNETIEI